MTKEQRTKSKEERTKNKEQLTKSRPFHCSLLIAHCFLLTVLCSLFIACDIDPDFMQRIDDEIAWRNADKLTVRLDYHSNWGSSNPQRGNITPGMDIRKGYAFSVEFSPAPAYSLFGWEAYAYTEAELPAGWRDNLSLLDPDRKLKAEDEDEDEDGDIVFPSDINPNGGIFTFTIKKPVPVTLIPICRTQPRVLWTEPSNDLANAYSRATNITIYFNAQMDEETVVFGNDLISIKDDKGDTIESHFVDPVYTELGGFYYATIASRGTIDWETVVVVSIGEELKNAGGIRMANNTMSFSYKIVSATQAVGSITEWKAEYKENPNGTTTIDVTYTHAGGSRMEAVYREGRGTEFPLPSDGRIPVNRINTNGVKNGQAISGITEYTITITLYAGQFPEDRVTFRMWNFPGLITSKANPAMEIIDANSDKVTNNDARTIGLSKVPANCDGQYVLVNSFSVTDHEPIVKFQGKFFGNGHTVTVNSVQLSVNSENIGLFGVVSGNTVVRDLTVNYQTIAGDAVQINPTVAAHFGGIAGSTQGNAQLINVITTGSVVYNVSGDTHANVGGLVGLMVDSSSVYNSYSGLGLTVNKTHVGESTVSLHIGGLVGSMGDRINGSPVSVRESSAAGNITVGSETYPVNVANADTCIVGFGLCVGGIAGFIQGEGDFGNFIEEKSAVLHNSEYKQGIITIWNGTSFTLIGGAVGYSFNADIKECTAQQGSLNINKTGFSGWICIGGFIGASYDSTIEYCNNTGSIIFHSDIDEFLGVGIGGFIGYMQRTNIFYCYATGKVSVLIKNGMIDAGGFIGELGGTISYCFAAGIVNAVSTGDAVIYAGGFAGRIYYGNVNNCYATGDVFADMTQSDDYIFSAGGFSGFIQNMGEIEHCFSAGNVIAQRKNHTENLFSVGGLVGFIDMYGPGNISNTAALGSSLTATGSNDTIRNVGRIFGGTRINTGGTLTLANNHAFNGMRIFQSDTYGDARPAEITAPPVITGLPVLQGSLNAPVMSGTPSLTGEVDAAVITGLTAGNFSSLTVGRNPGTAGGSPTWSGSNITGIDLSGLTSTSHHLRFFFTLRDSAGSTANYSFEIKPKRNNTKSVPVIIYEADGETIKEVVIEEIEDPLTIDDFAVSSLSLLNTNIVPVSISGLIMKDANGLNPANTSMAVTYNGNGSAGNPIWNGNSINGFNLSSLTAVTHWLRFDFTLRDHIGNNAVYRIQVNPSIENPTSVSHFDTAITLQSSSSSITSNALGQHGADVNLGTTRLRSFWTGSAPSGLGFSPTDWDFTLVGIRGYPRLRDDRGGVLGGQ
ncbi:MAG: hypothetical protein FWD26_09995 [Treponema sp.]|nr:hypothetical protein [Treponema sp.]